MSRSLAVLLVAIFLAPSALPALDKTPANPAGVPAKVKEALPIPATADKGKLKTVPGQSDMIEVESDKLDIYRTTGQALFQGNVQAKRGDMNLKSKTLRLYYDNATKKLTQMTASGAVFLHYKDMDSTCDQAVYLFNERRMILTGNVIMTRGEERVKGERVIMDMATEHQIVEGGRGSRVKIKVKSNQGIEMP